MSPILNNQMETVYTPSLSLKSGCNSNRKQATVSIPRALSDLEHIKEARFSLTRADPGPVDILEYD